MKVSVVMIVFNHARYVAQAIESVLIQLGDFETEILIGDDCSTDGSREIIADFTARFPAEIKPIFHENNLGGGKNLQSVYNRASGDFLAILEGDDHWTDPLKLSKQIAFLESHQDCSMCFHDVVMYHEDGSTKPHAFSQTCGRPSQPLYALSDLLIGNFIQTCSVLYRAGIVRELPDWIVTMPMGDWPLHLLHAMHGPIGFLDEIMAVYRLHSSGVWASIGQSERLRHSIVAAERIDEALQHRFHVPLLATQEEWRVRLVHELLKEGKREQAFQAVTDFLSRDIEPSRVDAFLPGLHKTAMHLIIGRLEAGALTEALAMLEDYRTVFPTTHVAESRQMADVAEIIRAKVKDAN